MRSPSIVTNVCRVGSAERTSFMDGVKVEAALAALHDDPRRPALLRRMGLEP
jgi:hypothetical protein